MRRTTATAIVVLALLIMAGIPARTNAASPDPTRTDLSSLSAIEAYLASIGVDPGSVVVQHGRFNYAGPNCPGAGWDCTTANMVVQISTSTSPGANIFDCLPSLDAVIPALNECLIVQSSVLNPLETTTTLNSASCDTALDDGSGRTKCTIRQQSKKGNNNAVIQQHITQRVGSPQSATEIAEITQTSDSGRNTVRIVQTIDQSLNIGTPADPTQKQEAHQTATVDQSSGSGNNSSDVQQAMLQVENAQSNANITQDQNTDSTSGRNQVARITQTTAAPGTNTSNLSHQITQRQSADCPGCVVTQTQGSSSGGQRGTVIQTTGSVTQTTIAAQSEDQQQVADTHGGGTWIRSQTGPQDCCGEQHGGTTGNVNSVDQTSTEQNGGGSTVSTQTGTCSEDVVGAQCSVHETVTQNGVPHHNDCPPPSTGSCAIFQVCTGEFCGGDPPVLLGALPFRERVFALMRGGWVT